MTLDELSVEFDILYNNISSNQAPGLTEYEKSVFLTQAQEAVILDLYKGTAGDSFETTEEVTRYLNSLVKTTNLVADNSRTKPIIAGINGYVYNIPEADKIWFITYQAATIKESEDATLKRDVLVVPTIQDGLYKTLNNPFKGPNKNRVLNLSEEGSMTLYSKYPIDNVYIKYLAIPYPIILNGALDEVDITIRNESESKELDWLPEILHNQILVRAVQIAKLVWSA